MIVTLWLSRMEAGVASWVLDVIAPRITLHLCPASWAFSRVFGEFGPSMEGREGSWRSMRGIEMRDFSVECRFSFGVWCMGFGFLGLVSAS